MCSEIGYRAHKMHSSILDVAEQLFRRYGLQKTTVADIAFELHMSSSNVYRFFATKNAIAVAVCKRIVESIEFQTGEIASSGGDASNRLRSTLRFLEVQNKKYFSDQKLHELIVISSAKDRELMREHNLHIAAIFGKIIADGMSSGAFRQGDPDLMARLIIEACRFYNPRFTRRDDSVEASFDQMVEFCLAAIGQGSS